MACHLQQQQQIVDDANVMEGLPPNGRIARRAAVATMVKTANRPKGSIGINLRVTGHCQQGGRKYMEDFLAVAYQQTADEKDLEYAFFGIFDGHGGAEAAAFAKEHLMANIIKDSRFWLDDDDDILQSIRDGFVETHHAMWRIHDKWPRTASGLPSTAGTTASVAFIRRGKIYVGHVGDSGITLGYQPEGAPADSEWQARALTTEHKPESAAELARIERAGGKVVAKMGVPRVVWNRPRVGHAGPVRRSTPIDEIPFLAVARSLGDLWSYNGELDEFVVSPRPDVAVVPIDTATFRCLVFGTDGLYNMLSAQQAVRVVQEAERRNEAAALRSASPAWLNPSKTLVDRALARWCTTKMRADNTSVITLMLDPPGPPKAQVLLSQRLGQAPPPPPPTEEEGGEAKKTATADDDIQINEVTSSSPADGKRKSASPGRKINFIMHRRINLRSSSNSLENAPPPPAAPGCSASDSRVLRERRNGASASQPLGKEAKKKKQKKNKKKSKKSGVVKKVGKSRTGNASFSPEKRRLLSTLLFRGAGAMPKKADENVTVGAATPSTSAMPEQRRSERTRKSALEQQKAASTFLKAKLRARMVVNGGKLKRHAKEIRPFKSFRNVAG